MKEAGSCLLFFLAECKLENGLFLNSVCFVPAQTFIEICI